MLTLVTTTNSNSCKLCLHEFVCIVVFTQQCVKHTDFSKSKFRSYVPCKQIAEHTHIAISLCVRPIRTSSISYSLTYATAALHGALPHNHVRNILTSSSQNSGPMTPGDKLLNILTLATTAIFLCVRYIRTSPISYSLTHVTAALHSALLPHQCVKYICHKLQQLIHIQYNVNTSHQNTHK